MNTTSTRGHYNLFFAICIILLLRQRYNNIQTQVRLGSRSPKDKTQTHVTRAQQWPTSNPTRGATSVITSWRVKHTKRMGTCLDPTPPSSPTCKLPPSLNRTPPETAGNGTKPKYHHFWPSSSTSHLQIWRTSIDQTSKSPPNHSNTHHVYEVMRD